MGLLVTPWTLTIAKANIKKSPTTLLSETGIKRLFSNVETIIFKTYDLKKTSMVKLTNVIPLWQSQ